MSKFCGNCGAQFDDTAKVCGYCGVPLSNESVNTNATSNPGISEADKATGAKSKKILIGVLVIVSFLAAILLVLYPTVIKPMRYYKNAENYAANGDYGVAIELLQYIDTERGHEMMEEYLSDMVDAGKFDEIDNIFANSFYLNNTIDDKDASVMASISKKLAHAGQHSFVLKTLKTLKTLEYDIIKHTSYSLAEEFETNGNDAYAAMYYGVAGDYNDSNDRSFALWDEFSQKKTFDAGAKHTVAVTTYGTVYATGDNEFGQCDVEKWTDVVSVAAGKTHTVGLKSDGTVVAVGNNEDEQCEVKEWTDIVAIDAGNDITIGLKSDGTIVYCGSTTLISMSKEVYTLDCVVNFSVDLSAVFIRADGSLIGASGSFESCGETLVEEWTDIQDVSVGSEHTIGLKRDGTVIATEFETDLKNLHPYYSQCEVDGVHNAIAVAAGAHHTAIVFSNGRAGAVGLNDEGQCEVSGFSNLTDVSAGDKHTVFLKKDGTLVAVGDNTEGQCDVDEWDNIKTPS